MGTEITLDIGGMTISWSKNDRGHDHGFLFQSADRKRFPSEDVDHVEGAHDEFEEEEEMGLRRPLRTVVPRLELLGYTIAAAKFDYDEMARRRIVIRTARRRPLNS